jgi:hypothetical protein
LQKLWRVCLTHWIFGFNHEQTMRTTTYDNHRKWRWPWVM